jgi:hypothetical protein
MMFPKPYFIDLDHNLAGPIRKIRELNLPLPVGFDILDKDEAGKAVDLKDRYVRLTKLLAAADANPDIETIVIDSATNLSTVLVSETLRLQGKSAMSKQEWGFFFTYGKQLMDSLTTSTKHIVLTGHEKESKTESGAIVFPIELAWPGQLGKIMGAFFTDVWRCEAKLTPSGLDTITEYVVRTSPNNQYALKNGFGLPPVMKFDWKAIQEKLLSSK